MPAWMSLLLGSVASPATPQCARLFLVKAVLHVEARYTARMAAAAEQEQVEQPPNLTLLQVPQPPRCTQSCSGWCKLKPDTFRFVKVLECNLLLLDTPKPTL